MLKACRSYEEACRTFRWRIPELYNLAFDACDRQTLAGADGHRTALIVEQPDGTSERATFQMLRLLSNRLANVLTAKGVLAGDRVLVSLAPSIEAAVTVLAVVKMGAVAVPVPPSLGEIPLAWRIEDSGARVAVMDGDAVQRVPQGHTFRSILVPENPPKGCLDLWKELEAAPDSFSPAVTSADAPAFLFYPSDAMGQPAGLLHAHRMLPGNLPAVEFALGFFPQAGDILWTPAEWMSFEALAWAILPAWHHGVTVLATQDSDPARQLSAVGRHGVRVAWVPPRTLARMCQIGSGGPSPSLRALATGPEPLPPQLAQLVRDRFATPANEIWGSIETGAVVSNGEPIMERLASSPGRAVPGCTVEAVDTLGRPLPADENGLLAAAPGTPGSCLGRWNQDGWTGIGLPSGWIPQGLVGHRDLDGYVFADPLEADPLIAVVDGLPVSVTEVEEALAEHPDVAQAAILVMPNGELKACVVPASGHVGDVELAKRLQAHVERRRAAHEAPRRVEFVADIPMTPQGPDRDALANRPIRLDAPQQDDRWGR
jgi:acetyl-CoA synthetase